MTGHLTSGRTPKDSIYLSINNPDKPPFAASAWIDRDLFTCSDDFPPVLIASLRFEVAFLNHAILPGRRHHVLVHYPRRSKCQWW